MQADQLTPLGGEFRDARVEARFREERVSEVVRLARLALMCSAVLNTLFLGSDFRFWGQDQFWVAVPARCLTIAVSLACFMLVAHARSFRAAERWIVTYEIVTGVCVGFLVSSQTIIALFVVFMLPGIFYLVMPKSFRWTLVTGIGTSVMMLIGFLWRDPIQMTTPGFIMVMMMHNVALLLVVARTNRWRRLEWAATQAERQAKGELNESRRLFRSLFMEVPLPLVVSRRSTGELILVNEATRRLFEDYHTKLEGMRMNDFYVEPADRLAFVHALETNGRVEGFETALRLPDGRLRNVMLSGTTIEIDGETCIMTGVTDITQRKELELNLERLATTDPLTGLANRHRFFALATQLTEAARAGGRPLTVMMIDLDHFKHTNDTYGHEVGDAVLQAFAQMSQGVLREGDLIARYGGEEFSVILPDSDEKAAAAVAERLREAARGMRAPLIPDAMPISISIGLCSVRPHETTPQPALARADRALYAAKRAGRDRVVTFEALSAERQTRRALALSA